MNIFRILKNLVVPAYIRLDNTLFHRPSLSGRLSAVPGDPEAEIRAYAAVRSDISDHLMTLYHEAMGVRPRLIVELGTRGGASTFVFQKAAEQRRIPLVSVDLDPCDTLKPRPFWTFVQSDDIAFAQRFPEWCRQHKLPETIDLLFIDTSHEYAHTQEEIRHWFPLVSEQGKIIFHDTHLRTVYRRLDGSLGLGWDNQRGVIRAIEEALETSLDETRSFEAVHKGFRIRHHAHCCGLTILDRLPVGVAGQ